MGWNKKQKTKYGTNNLYMVWPACGSQYFYEKLCFGDKTPYNLFLTLILTLTSTPTLGIYTWCARLYIFRSIYVGIFFLSPSRFYFFGPSFLSPSYIFIRSSSSSDPGPLSRLLLPYPSPLRYVPLICFLRDNKKAALFLPSSTRRRIRCPE